MGTFLKEMIVNSVCKAATAAQASRYVLNAMRVSTKLLINSAYDARAISLFKTISAQSVLNIVSCATHWKDA